jgi:hypothetical protein
MLTPEEENQLWHAWLEKPEAQQAEGAESALVAHSLTIIADAPPAQISSALVAHSLALMEGMPTAQAGTSSRHGIASHAMSEASRLRDELEVEKQKIMDWQQAQAAAMQNPRMMRLHAPGAGFMSTRDFALRLSEAGLQRECGPQTGAAQHVYHIIANASESPCRLFLSCPHSPMPYSLSHRWRARSR